MDCFVKWKYKNTDLSAKMNPLAYPREISEQKAREHY
jgi:hypothetical protein